MFGLKKVLEMKAERLRKKEEKRRKKNAERMRKVRAKKKRQEERHKKTLRRRQNKRYYNKKKKARIKWHEQIGDVYSYYVVMLAKNNVLYKRIANKNWRSAAYEVFNSMVEENDKIKFSVKYERSTKSELEETGSKEKKVRYELVIVELVKNPTEEYTTRQFRNEDGYFVDNVIENDERMAIIAKHPWKIEEKFYVYGYDRKDKKDFDFVLNDVVMKDCDDKYLSRRVFTYGNKLVVQYDDNFDFVVCKNSDDAERLYDMIEESVDKRDKKYVFFNGVLASSLSGWMIDELVKKTGWPRSTCASNKIYR